MGSFTGEEEILSGLMIAHGDMLYIDCVYNVLKKICIDIKVDIQRCSIFITG